MVNYCQCRHCKDKVGAANRYRLQEGGFGCSASHLEDMWGIVHESVNTGKLIEHSDHYSQRDWFEILPAEKWLLQAMMFKIQ
ncbi:hypothetical protein ES703_84790 [subsurface metagenome]